MTGVYPLRLLYNDGRELTVYVIERVTAGQGQGDDGYVICTRIQIDHDGQTGYVLERITGGHGTTWQPCERNPVNVYGQPWPHFDQAVMELVTMLEAV